jgi:hypothetical protein
MANPVQWKHDLQHLRSEDQNFPKSAARRRKAGPNLPASIGLALLLGMLASACDNGKQSAATTPPASQAPVAAAPANDCSAQADREAFIEKQIAQGHWQKVGRVARTFHVHVMPEYMTETTPEDQQRDLAQVSAYSGCAGGESRVVIHDATTGEQIGAFSEAGLELK